MLEDFFQLITIKKISKTFIHNYLFCLNSEEQKYKEIYTNEINKLKTSKDFSFEDKYPCCLFDNMKNTNTVIVSFYKRSLDNINVSIDNKVKILSFIFEMSGIDLLSIDNKYIKKLIILHTCNISVNCKNIHSLNISYISKNVKLYNTSYISCVHINKINISDIFIYYHFVNTRKLYINQSKITMEKNILDFSNFINIIDFSFNCNILDVPQTQENKINIITPPNATILYIDSVNNLKIPNMAILTNIDLSGICLTNSIYLSQIPKIKSLTLFKIKHTDPSKNIIIFDSPVKNLDFLNIYKCDLDYDEFFNNLHFFPKLKWLSLDFYKTKTIQKPTNLDFSVLTTLKTLSLSYTFSLNCKIKNIFPLSLTHLQLCISPNGKYYNDKEYIVEEYIRDVDNNLDKLKLNHFYFNK